MNAEVDVFPAVVGWKHINLGIHTETGISLSVEKRSLFFYNKSEERKNIDRREWENFKAGEQFSTAFSFHTPSIYVLIYIQENKLHTPQNKYI
jgi:hypothetical protein